MSGSVWLRWHWPQEVELDQAVACLRVLHSFSGRAPRDAMLLEVASSAANGIEHRLRLPRAKVGAVESQLRQAMPGVRLDVLDDVAVIDIDIARELLLSTGRRSLAVDRIEQIAAGVLAALARINGGSQVVQWWLGPPRSPMRVPTHLRLPATEMPLLRTAASLLGLERDLDAEARKALAAKQGRSGWQASARIGVAGPHASGCLRALLGAFRVAQAPGVTLRSRPVVAHHVSQRRTPRRWPLLVNVDELVGLAALPVGDVGPMPLSRAASRLLPADAAIPSSPRQLGRSTYPGPDRTLGLSYEDSLRHLHVLGPTGVGKSTLLLNLILQDAQAGHGVVVIEPKGDLIEAVLARLHASRHRDVIVIDPADTQRPVGLNPLADAGGSPELVVDHLVAVFKGLFGDSWGPRLQDMLTAGLLTLAHHRGATLVMLPQLFTDAHLRRTLRGQVRDPLALDPFWSWYENLSETNRSAVLAPLMNKLRAFLLRPTVRGVIGQAEPRLDLPRAIAERKIVLVDLSRGHLGAESANLLGSLVFAGVWAAIRQRSTTDARRRFVGIFVDEFQEYLRLPTDTAELLALSRSLGAGMVMAHQHLDQLDSKLRAAVLANARSRVVFQLGYDDAQTLARGHQELTPGDLMGLPAFHAYAALSAGGRVRQFASLSTFPAPKPSADAASLRQFSRQQYGRPIAEIEASWRTSGDGPDVAEPIGAKPRRRTS